MSVLRKEQPSPTTDVASQNRAAVGPAGNETRDEANIDPGTRRPPQSVATPVTDDTSDPTVDDTYDGEILSSTIDETDETSPKSPTPKAGAPRPDQNPGPQATAPRSSQNPTPQAAASRASQNPGPAAEPSASQNSAPQSAATHPQSPQAANGQEDTHLFDEEELRDFRARWDQVQTSFVDEPRHAVEQADALVGTVVKRIADQFSEERAKLEKQWSRGENVSTEDLRQGFRRYRAFFDRLLSF
jgi:hypothetical protein